MNKFIYGFLSVVACGLCQATGIVMPKLQIPEMIEVTLPSGKQASFAKYPITVGQFRSFIQDSGYKTKSTIEHEEGCWGIRDDRSVGWMPDQNWSTNNLQQADNHPVVCVTREDAMAYADWLSSKTGKVFRLPRVDEWESVAHGTIGETYIHGDQENELCQFVNHADLRFREVFNEHAITSFCNDGYKLTSPVGSFPPNSLGLYDMYGNVWEWQLDCAGEENGSKPCDEYVLKGGSYASQPKGVSIGYSITGSSSFRTADYGFRVVKVDN